MMNITSMVYKRFDKRSYATHANNFAGCNVTNEIMPNQTLSEELQQLIIRKFEKQKYIQYIDNIWGSGYADM